MQYDFSIIALLKEGFRRTEGVKLIFFGAVFIYFVISLLTNQALGFIFPNDESVANFYVASVLEAIFTIPILVGINMLAVKRVREEETLVPSIFDYYSFFIPLMFAYLAMTALILTGFILFILPAIYLIISYVFTYTLMVDKNMDLWEAMELSRKAVTAQWFKFFGLGLMSCLILILGLIPLGIGLVWAIPTVYLSYALLYHRLFDEEEN
ncbi:hypothetical protein N9A28_09765 [Sulfurimonas sp.]|nr:hypothetical protein [Sulfurimonas sp.]